MIPTSGLSGLRRWVGRFFIAFVIMAGVVYYFFSPVFEGYTLSEVAGYKNLVYPWAYQPTEQPETVDTDQADRFYPQQVLLHRALKSGDFPLWDPYRFLGRPFFSNGWNMLLYPPRVFLSLVTTPTKAHDILLLSHMLFGGLTMFLLLSDSRLSFAASLFGSLSWMLNSFMLAWMSWEGFMAIEALLPLAVLLVRAAFRHRRSLSICLGIVMALIFFGGQLQFVQMSFSAVGCYAIYIFVRKCRRASRGTAGLRFEKAVDYGLILVIPALVVYGSDSDPVHTNLAARSNNGQIGIDLCAIA